MKNKFKYLTKESIKKKIGTKWFKIINIILLLVISTIINIDSIIKIFGGEFNDEIIIYVKDEINIYDDIVNSFNSNNLESLESLNLKFENTESNIDELKKNLNEDNKNIILLLTKSENVFDAQVISYDYVDTILYQSLISCLDNIKTQKALLLSGIDVNLLENVYSKVNIERIILNDKLDENSELTEFISGILILVLILPIFFLIILIVQMIGAEINEEKTSKSMEIIISSVDPKIHFLSKIVSSNLFAIIQGTLLILYALVGIIIKLFTMNSSQSQIVNSIDINQYINIFLQSDILNSFISALPLIIILILLTFFAYSIFIGVLASMTTSMEDYQQLQIPVMIFLMIGYYLAIMASVYDGSLFINIASYIPLISGILAPVLYSLGQITIYDLVIDILLSLLVCYLLYKYGMKIYKNGILNYSSKNLWKKMFSSLKN